MRTQELWNRTPERHFTYLEVRPGPDRVMFPSNKSQVAIFFHRARTDQGREATRPIEASAPRPNQICFPLSRRLLELLHILFKDDSLAQVSLSNHVV